MNTHHVPWLSVPLVAAVRRLAIALLQAGVGIAVLYGLVAGVHAAAQTAPERAVVIRARPDLAMQLADASLLASTTALVTLLLCLLYVAAGLVAAGVVHSLVARPPTHAPQPRRAAIELGLLTALWALLYALLHRWLAHSLAPIYLEPALLWLGGVGLIALWGDVLQRWYWARYQELHAQL